MRKFILTLTLTLAVTLPAAAQRINLDFPDLEERADEVVDVTLDADMLRIAAKFLGNDPNEKAVKDMVRGLTGIYVRSYSFDKSGQYDKGLVDSVKRQLGPTWKPLVRVRSKTRENAYIYADMRGDKVTGLIIIAAEPREFTVVNIVGPIDIEKLAELEGEFGIPRITRDEDDDHE